MTYITQFRDSLTWQTKLPEGYQRQYRFPNNFGASVIQHDRGDLQGKWEVCLLQFDVDECQPMTTLLDDPTQAQVFYFDSIDPVGEQIQILAGHRRPHRGRSQVRFIEWRELEVFDTTMTVPVIEIHTATQTGEEEGDWCKEQVEQAVGPWLVEHSVMWVMTYPKHRSHKADGAA